MSVNLPDTKAIQKHIDGFAKYLLIDTKLPLEIVYKIASYLDLSDVARPSQVSREAERLANSVLYNDLRARLENYVGYKRYHDVPPCVLGGQSLVDLIRSLLRDARKASRVRSISLVDRSTHDSSDSHRPANAGEAHQRSASRPYLKLDGLNRVEIKFYRYTASLQLVPPFPPDVIFGSVDEWEKITQPNVSALAGLLIRLATHLQSLHIGMEWLRYNDLREIVSGLVPAGELDHPRMACNSDRGQIEPSFRLAAQTLRSPLAPRKTDSAWVIVCTVRGRLHDHHEEAGRYRDLHKFR